MNSNLQHFYKFGYKHVILYTIEKWLVNAFHVISMLVVMYYEMYCQMNHLLIVSVAAIIALCVLIINLHEFRNKIKNIK